MTTRALHRRLARPRVRTLLHIAASIVVAGAVAIVAVGCSGQRAQTPVDAWASTPDPGAMPLPTTAALLALRVPAPPSSPPADLRATSHEHALLVGDRDGVHSDDPSACLLATIRRDYDVVDAVCPRAVVALQDDPRAAVLLRQVARGFPARSHLRDDVLALDDAPLRACRAARATHPSQSSCADLAVVLADVQTSAARALGRRDAARAAALRTGSISSAVVDGPFLDGPCARVDGSVCEVTPRRHPRARTRTVVADSDDSVTAGMLLASRAGPRGFYDVTHRFAGQGPVTLYVRSAGPLRAFVDDNLVLQRLPGAAPADVERVRVDLSPGTHRVRVFASDDGAGIGLALLDDDGLALPAAPDGDARPAGARVSSSATGGFVVPATLDAADGAQAVQLLWRVVAARAGLGVTRDEMLARARQAIAVYGWSTTTLAVGLEAMQDDDALPERVQHALLSPLWQRVLVRWPGHPVALIDRARALRDEQPDAALAALRDVVEQAPAYPFGRRDLIEQALEVGLVDEARASADALLAQEHSRENIDASLGALRATGALLQAAQLVDERAQMDPASGWPMLLLSRGERARARELLAAGVSADITTASPYLVDALLELDELDAPAEARALVQRLLQQAPDDVELALRAARLSMALGDLDAARAQLRTLPSDMRVWRLREELGETMPWEAHRALGVDVLEARAARTDPWPGSAAVFLLDDQERIFADDGTSLKVRHIVVELRNKEALDAWGEIHVGDDERLLQLRVLKPDGRSVEPERHAQVDDVSLPGLAPGDIVELLVASTSTSARLGPFWETTPLQGPVPAVVRRSTIRWPTRWDGTRDVSLIIDNGAPVDERIEDGMHVARAEMHDVAPLWMEPGALPREDVEPLFGIRIDVDDGHWARVRSRPFLARLHVDAWLRDVAHLIAGNGRDEEKLARLFRFVATRIESADDVDDPITTLALGRGDRLELFVALAREAALRVELVATHAPGGAPQRAPSSQRFSAVMARVTIGPRAHFVFLQGNVAALDALPPLLRGAPLIVIDDDPMRAAHADAIPDDAIDTRPVSTSLALQEQDDGALVGTLTLRLPVIVADATRGALRRASSEQIVQMLEGALSSTLPGVQVTNAQMRALADAGTPLVLVCNVRVEPVATDGVVRFEHVFPDGAGAAFGAIEPFTGIVRVADRRRAAIVHAQADDLDVELRLAPASRFVETPPALAIDAGPVHLQQTSSVDGTTLRWRRRLTRDTAKVDAPSWPRIREAIGALLPRLDARIVFTVGKGRT